MVQTIGRILGRVLIILLAAGIVAGGVVALSQSAFGAGPAGFPGGPRDDQAQAQLAGAPPDSGAAPFARPGGDFGGPGRGMEAGAQFSLVRGLPALLKNVAIIGILIGVVSLVRYVTRRRPAQTAL